MDYIDKGEMNMASNTSKGRAVKGSKFWVQTIINSSMRLDLEEKIGLGPITWLSPLRAEGYTEYKLNQENMRSQLKLTKEDLAFWPQNEPQWDAIGVAGDTIILVEAKAHIEETVTNMSATSNESIARITKAMKEIFDIMNHLGNGNFESWVHKYYQLGNRLTFLQKLNQMPNKKAKLVLLNIVEDPTYKCTSMAEWETHTKAVFNEITGSPETPEHVIVVNFQV